MNDIVRIGKISTIDYEAGTASVVYTDRNNEPSPNFPFFSLFYEMPKLDDTVVVLLLPNSTTRGFILGVPFSKKKIPFKSGKNIFYKKFHDGTHILYDSEKKTMEITANHILIKGRLKAETIEADSLIVKEIIIKEKDT